MLLLLETTQKQRWGELLLGLILLLIQMNLYGAQQLGKAHTLQVSLEMFMPVVFYY